MKSKQKHELGNLAKGIVSGIQKLDDKGAKRLVRTTNKWESQDFS